MSHIEQVLTQATMQEEETESLLYIFPFNNQVKDADKDPDLSKKISRELPVIIRHLLTLFVNQDKAKRLLLEQRSSSEALVVKRVTNPVIALCASLSFLEEPRGLMMGGG